MGKTGLVARRSFRIFVALAIFFAIAKEGLTRSDQPATAAAPIAKSDGATPASAEAVAGGWEQLFKRGDITVFRKQVEGSKIYALRIAGRIKAPFAKLVTVMRDTPHKNLWMKMLKEARIVSETGNEREEYYRFSPPFPLKNRELLVHSTLTIDPIKKTVTIASHSIEDPAIPETPGTIRANLISARVTLSPLAGGKEAYIDSEAHAEPKGPLPSGLINLLQRTAPKHSLDDLLERLTKAEIPDYPGLGFAYDPDPKPSP